jgi:hypothetical protein
MNSECLTDICNPTTGTCAAHCCSDMDCAATETCDQLAFAPTVLKRICRPRTMTAGTSTFGASCNANLDCDSEVCAPVHSMLANPRQCSTYCCKDSDCAVLPGGGICYPVTGQLANTWVGLCFSD